MRPPEAGPVPGAADLRERARSALLAELHSPREIVGSEAALALGRLGDVRSLPALAAIVEDPEIGASRRAHRWAALAIGMLPAGDAEPEPTGPRALLDALDRARGRRDRFSSFWANGAYALAMRGDARVVPELVELRRRGLAARTASASLHATALGPLTYALGALGQRDVLPVVERQLHGEKTADGGAKDTSWCACQALAEIPGDDARRLLCAAAADPRPTVRMVAIQALGSVAGPDDADFAEVLLKAVSDEESRPRQMALVSLGRTGHASAAAAVVRHFERGLAADRAYAALGLGLLGRRRPDPGVRDFLARHLETAKDAEERAALSLACGLARADAARPAVVRIAASGSPEVAAQACFALGLLDTPADQRAALYTAVEEGREFLVGREASLALGLLEDPTVVGRLESVARSPRLPDARRAAALVELGRIGDEREVDLYLHVLRERGISSGLESCACHGLGLLLDRDEGARLGRITADALWCSTSRGQMPEPIQDLQVLAD